MAGGQIVETSVGALRHALAGEHPGRILFRAPIGINSCGVRISTRQVLLHQECQLLAPVLELGHRDLRYPLMAETFDIVLAYDLLAAYGVAILRISSRLGSLGPLLEQIDALIADLPHSRVVCDPELVLCRLARQRVLREG